MKKQRNQLLILLGILAVCVAAYFAAGAYAEQKEAEEDAANEEYVALSFEGSYVVRLEINGSAGQLLLDYDGSTWSFVNDISAEMAELSGGTSDDASGEEAADADEEESSESGEISAAEYEVNSTTANTILGYLEELTSEYEITPEEELSAYGLDTPSMTVTITMEDGTVYSVVFGDYNEMLSAYYFYVNDADTLYSLGTYTYNILNKCDTDVADEIEVEEEETEESSEDEEAEASEGETDEASEETAAEAEEAPEEEGESLEAVEDATETEEEDVTE